MTMAGVSEPGGAARRGRPSAESTRQRMASLLETARQMFVTRGYRATTMDDVAAAAGVTKRTLYAWHQDKESLFRACILLGAARFPQLAPGAVLHAHDLQATLEHYVLELHAELTRPDSYGMGALFLREAAEFPELAASVQRGHLDFMIGPLAAFLRRHGLEDHNSVEQSMLFVAMALSPLHNAMLVGMALPGAAETQAHAKRCVRIFLRGAPRN
jgi:TetR/AcrR family transcriptional repressor of mexJK operon